jgi:hypothetical protein
MTPQMITPTHPINRRLLAMHRARLLKGVFDIDSEQCPPVGGTLKIIAALEEPPVITKILSHLGLPLAPPRYPAR